MRVFFRLTSCILLTGLLISCASTDSRVTHDVSDAPGQAVSENYQYAAWRIDGSADIEAIHVLLADADILIKKHAYNAAADKLERALRIKPEYAPAWSRLSWLALQTNSPKHSVQMARRSNSFAYSDVELQALNWSFIRAASKALNDDETYHRANQKIESLKAF